MSAARVQCQLCPWECVLSPGQRGRCRARQNIGGELATLVYGNPCAVNIDPMEKKPLFHFHPATTIFSIATAGCNFSCSFCQNWQISQSAPEDVRGHSLSPRQVVEEAIRAGCRSIAYTYNEPVIFFEYAYDCAALAREKGIRNVLVTNGFINEEPLRRLCRVLDAANVDLKGDDDYYRRICGGRLAPVERTIEVMKEEGVWVEITNLVVPTLNDRAEDFRRLSQWVRRKAGADTPLFFSRFTPMYRLQKLPLTPTSTLQQARGIAREEGLNYVYTGNIRGVESESTFCPDCGKMIIKRIGYGVPEMRIKEGGCAFCGRPIAGVWS